MYKKYDIPFSLLKDDWGISFLKQGKMIHYERKSQELSIEEKLLSNIKSFKLMPVEPLSFPKPLTEFLLIELEQLLVAAPHTTQIIYLTFPIEIGVFLPQAKEWRMLDVFSIAKTKFTLYGDPASGIICKHWSSPASDNIPAVDFLKEGIIKLEINNESDDWQHIQKILLKAENMKIFFNNEIVSMQAKMKILSMNNAEVSFINQPIQNDMNKSIEIFSQKKLSLSSSKIYMLEGI